MKMGSGDVDGEMRKLHNSFRIQHALTSVLDKIQLHTLQQRFVDEGLEEDIRRLADVQDASVQEHTLRQQLNPETNRLLPDSEWIVAMRLRLGALVIPVDGLCGYCGERCMDSNGYHSLCCALGESTRGHNRVRNLHAAFCGQADPGTTIEVPGLCPRAPSLRPADTLTEPCTLQRTLPSI